MKKVKLSDDTKGLCTLILSILAVYSIIWAFTEAGLFSSSVYNSYVLQARRWLTGNLDLGQNYEWLEIAEFNNKFFISFPPIPSVIMLPFCLIFKESVPDYFITVIIGIIGAIYAYKIFRSMSVSWKNAVFWSLFATIGSNFLHIGYNGSVWYIAQVCGFTFTMMAFYYAMKTDLKFGWLPMFLLALAVGCRPLNAVYLPFIAYLMFVNLRKNEIKLGVAIRKFYWWIIPPLVVGVFYMWLNYARFGNVFEFGHNYLPEFAKESVNGQFHLSYIKENLVRMFRLPELADGKLVFPEFDGVAFWLVSPIFIGFVIYFFKNIRKNIKSPEVIMTIILIALHILLLCAHKTLGGWQFGNRYTVDTGVRTCVHAKNG
ncbi:MAG: hypothetical protein RSA27_00180 [Oscillospiraceae bacterium]